MAIPRGGGPTESVAGEEHLAAGGRGFTALQHSFAQAHTVHVADENHRKGVSHARGARRIRCVPTTSWLPPFTGRVRLHKHAAADRGCGYPGLQAAHRRSSPSAPTPGYGRGRSAPDRSSPVAGRTGKGRERACAYVAEHPEIAEEVRLTLVEARKAENSALTSIQRAASEEAA